MRILCSIAILLASALVGAGPPPPSTPTSQAESRPTSQSATSDRIRRLIAQLGHERYQLREAAQRELKAMGDAALPDVAIAISHENPEIARRAQALLRRPKDARLRVEIVRRLIATTNPALVEKGVYMLFENPIEDYALFRELTDNASGLERAMFVPICDQLGQWRRITELFESRQAKLISEKPEAAIHERNQHADSYYYQADAAYYQAMDAILDFREASAAGLTTSRPTSEPPAPTTRPAGD
ncbi:MAG TPA: hypothetical protein P5081_07960 [Phycisphaerae bacterium]|nr:hypothetical protein [Phycisphaerae bacterium]HRW52807.1 hypothetical protein [Phycisphaerae bacterium]